MINQYGKGAGVSRGPLKQGLLDIYPTTFFKVGNFGNTEAMRVIFLRKCWKFNADLKNSEKNSEKIVCFCIWIFCVELSHLIREYLSTAVNVLTKSLNTFHVTKSDFSNSITFKVTNKYGKGSGVKIESVFCCLYHVACRWVLSNGSF